MYFASRPWQNCSSSSEVAEQFGFECYDHQADLAPFLIRLADQRGILHTFVLAEDRLHFRGINILAAADDHVLEAADNVEISFLIHAGHVAGVEPAIP